MRREAKVVILIAALAVIGVTGIAVILTSLPLNPSRTFSIGELRSGTNFTLGGVRFNQTGFEDYQNGPIVDGGYVVSFHLTFADGTSEDLSFPFDGYCPAGSVSRVSTVHRSPMATFSHSCGDAFIHVTVLR